MALSRDRIIAAGQTPHAHEADAFDFVVRELPDTEPYRLWAFVDLVSPDGRRYDVDLLILGYHALYLVEVKSHPGVLAGDDVDWQFTFPSGGRTLIENPLRTTSHKARVLASRLERAFPRAQTANRVLRHPYVQPLVFLSHPELRVELSPSARRFVVTRETFRRAITHGEAPGMPEHVLAHPVNRPSARETHRVLKELGLRRSEGARKVGDYLLGELLEDSAHYQDYLGVNPSIAHLKKRVRTFVIPANTTAERRDQVQRAARREAQLLTTLSDHRNVLRLSGYAPDGPFGGPCVILDHFEDALPLDAFLRANPELSLNDKLELIRQLAEALEFCHRKQVVHRALNPRAILVRRPPAPPGGPPAPPELRLYNFQLAAGRDTSGTIHLAALSGDLAQVYVAPEALEDPAAADAVSDVFSLGAVAFHILTGRPPGATLAERAALLATGHLSIAAVRDDLAGGGARSQSLDGIVALATERNPHARADSAIEWVTMLLEAVTSPDAPEADQPAVDPLEARPGDRLADGLEVVALLGTGSTARVLRVRRPDGAEYALKVALSPDLDDRVRQEGQVLRALDSDRIVSLVEERTLGERVGLLMTDAGESLASLLAREGPPSLDFARRWGEDLLSALESLEQRGVQHRDIKPANLGVLSRQAKKTRSLLLFDFSLAGLGEGAITAGTPAYRDPFLERRGRWDAAADRWSAAMTLHELLTGTRPGWGAGDEPSAASEDEIRIAAERFDTAVRSRLSGFFRRALARDVAQRFDRAEAMRVAWVSCFATTSWTDDVAPAAAALGPRELAHLDPATPLEGLQLSARARNALDRAGMTNLGDLLSMPRNRLSTTRGIGRQTHQEILKLIEDVRAALGARLALPEQAPFFPEYHPQGPSGAVGFVPGLPAQAARALEDAGLPHLPAVAAAPRAQVERLLSPYADAAKTLRAFLHQSSAQAGAGAAAGAPATLEDWLEALLPPGGRRSKVLETTGQLLGLHPIPGAPAGERPADAAALARRLGVTRAAVHIALGKARERWKLHPRLGDLHAKVTAALELQGGVASLARVAEALVLDLPHRLAHAGGAVVDPAPGAPPALDPVAEAVVRIAAETCPALFLGRISGGLWVATGQGGLAVARALGARADELAAREPLPSSEEVREALGREVRDTPMGALAPDRLVGLAAEASRTAARSARLELYPRGLAAARALALSAGAFAPAQATPDAIRRVVRARYPEAEPPPERPALDLLLEPLGLVWQEPSASYVRPAAAPMTTFDTRPPRLATTHTSHRPPRPSQQSQEALEFEQRLRLAVEKRHFRVLDVAAGWDEAAVAEVIRCTGARRVSLEQVVLAHARRLMRELEISPELVYQADRQGAAAGEDWQNLCQLMKQAAAGAIAESVPLGSATPVVLTQPGILARYRLEDAVARLVSLAGRDDAPPVLLVNPADERPEHAVIDGVPKGLVIPLVSGAQRLKVPQPWIENRHRGGAPS